jgi:23S rRNA (uracil1939-C5)-methyltransferase
VVGRKVFEEMKLTCEKMLFGGLGLCRSENGIVFVEGLMPNETAECRQIGKTGGILVFGVEKLLEKSPERREPFCKYFGVCGGCDWQFMNYEAQISSKKEIFEDNLRRIGKIYEYPNPEVFFANEKNYRIRAKFSVDKKTQRIGFLSKKSHEIIEIDECPLLSENLNEFLADKNHNFTQKEIKIIDSENGEISVGKYKFEVNNNSFFQANKFLTVRMADWCKEQVFYCENLLDIYGGVGLFSVFCSEKAKNITLVEIDENMANFAQKTFKKNGILNAKAIGMSVEKFLSDEKINADCIIIDPPRVGLDKKVAEIIAKSTKKIIYISCNPTTQARDAKIFMDFGFRIVKTAIFDCYPNTFHIETGIVFEK